MRFEWVKAQKMYHDTFPTSSCFIQAKSLMSFLDQQQWSDRLFNDFNALVDFRDSRLKIATVIEAF